MKAIKKCGKKQLIYADFEKKELSEFLPEKLNKNEEIHCLSEGQINLIDIIEKILEQVSNANVDLTVWTAADANLKKAFDFILNFNIKKMRWCIDPSFRSRQPKYVATLQELFGEDCIRTVPTHAKLILIYNDEYNFIIQTSMNLNQNRRMESFTIIENKELVEFYKTFFDNIFSQNSSHNNFASQNIKSINLKKDEDSLFDFPSIF
jgi:hypothetical protein